MHAVRDLLEHPEPGHRRRHQVFIDAAEMYLRVIFEMEEEDGIALRPSVARRLGLTRPTVREQLERLVEDGMIDLERSEIVMTDEGRVRAATVVRKHRIAEAFLVQIVGLDWELAHVEASRWQHVVGARAVEKLAARLGDPQVSPFGCPIPARCDDDDAATTTARTKVDNALIRVIDASDARSSRVLIRRVPERLQTDRELLVNLRQAGIGPGVDAEVSLADSTRERVRVETQHGVLVLPPLASQSIVVEGERRRPSRRARPSRAIRGSGSSGSLRPEKEELNARQRTHRSA